MASIVGKRRGAQTYYYLVESARVRGKPRIVSQQYLGSADEVIAKLSETPTGGPKRSRHRRFGDLAAVWSTLVRLGVAGIVDEVVPRYANAAASVGTYLALACANRIVDPCSKRGFADWWATTAGQRWVRLGRAAVDHRRFWDAMDRLGEAELRVIETRLGRAMVAEFGLDLTGLALDMTNFATFIDTGNERAPIAQRGKAKQKRPDLRLVGLGLVVTRDGGIPLTWHAYPGDKPDVTQFTAMTDQLLSQYQAVCAAAGVPAAAADMTVVFDAGQNSEDNFAHLAGTNLHYIGSVPASDCRDLLALPASARTIVDEGRFGRLTAYDTRRPVYGTERRAILTHSPELHAHQARGFDGTTLAKAGRKLDELAATLARGKTRRARAKVEAEIGKITHDPWVRRVIAWQLAGEQPKDLRLAWDIDQNARAALEEEIFGKHVLITDHDDWPAAEVIAGYRSQSEAEFSFRQMKDPRVVSFSPMFHWTEHNIRVHAFTCVLALQIAHLLRLQAERAGL